MTIKQNKNVMNGPMQILRDIGTANIVTRKFQALSKTKYKFKFALLVD